MKTIEDLRNWLRRYNEVAPYDMNSIRIFSDGSGYLIGKDDQVIEHFNEKHPLPPVDKIVKPKEIVVDGVTYVRK